MRQPELPPYRPPSEAESALVRVTRGCAWNRCAFCGMYKGSRFGVRPLEEIVADLPLLRRRWPRARSVFLADSDALVHPRLPAIVEAVRAAFPEAERITSYARLHTLCQKPLAYLRTLCAAGLTRIHAGLESGDAAILERVRKGATPARAREAGEKALAAGFTLSLYLLCGLGGEEQWEAHADGSAAVAGSIAPQFLRLRTLVLLPGTPLHAAAAAGRFTPARPLTRLRETQRLLQGLRAQTLAREMEITSDHFSNYVWADGQLAYGGINGYLPAEGALLAETLAAAIATVQASARAHDAGALARRGHAPQLYTAL